MQIADRISNIILTPLILLKHAEYSSNFRLQSRSQVSSIGRGKADYTSRAISVRTQPHINREFSTHFKNDNNNNKHNNDKISKVIFKLY